MSYSMNSSYIMISCERFGNTVWYYLEVRLLRIRFQEPINLLFGRLIPKI